MGAHAHQRIAERWDALVIVHSGDPDRDRLGRLFNVLMIISIGIVVALTLIFLATQPLGLGGNASLLAATFPFAFLPFSLYCLVLSRSGRVRRAVKLYVWGNVVAISAAAWIFDGIRSPAWQLYIWTITIAGTLLRPGYALGMAGGVTAYFFVMLGLGQAGLYRPPLTLGPGLVFIEISFRVLMLFASVGVLTFLNMRGLRDTLARLRTEIAERKAVELERERLVGDLRESLANVKTLTGLLPICAACKKIRDDTGYWNRVEEYIGRHSEARFSHGFCPDCMEKLYPGR